MVVEAHQSFKFFRQNTWFLKNNRAFPKFLYEILHYLVSSNHNKISPLRNHASHLNSFKTIPFEKPYH